MKRFLLMTFVLCISAANAFAIIDIRSNTSAGYGKITGAAIDIKPTMINYSEDVAVTYSALPVVEFGLGGSYRFARQLSTVQASVGNFKGNRWEIYPVIAAGFAGFWVGVSPIALLGRYSMSKQTVDKKDVYYHSPLGAKLIVSRDLGSLLGKVHWGVSLIGDYVAYGKFTTTTVAGVSKENEMTDKLKVWTAGLAFSFGLGI